MNLYETVEKVVVTEVIETEKVRNKEIDIILDHLVRAVPTAMLTTLIMDLTDCDRLRGQKYIEDHPCFEKYVYMQSGVHY